jgi:FkbM family methyltransferase
MYNAKLIYDVGLFNGDDTAHYLSKGFNVVAIEADPVQAEKAGEKFKSFIEKGQLKILNIGVAAEDGEFDFYINEVQPEWNSFDLSIASRDGLPWHALKIKAKSFDNILREYGVPYYLKVDIEGHDHLCIKGLDANNLPRFISVEANYAELIDELAGKGFTKFKIIFQYNYAHLDLPPNKYFRRWLFGYRFRQWNSFPVKVFRKLGGSKLITLYDKTSIPAYSKGFNKGSSGNFGEQLGGKWHDKNEALKIYHHYYNLFHQLPNSKDYGFWADIHATW